MKEKTDNEDYENERQKQNREWNINIWSYESKWESKIVIWRYELVVILTDNSNEDIKYEWRQQWLKAGNMKKPAKNSDRITKTGRLKSLMWKQTIEEAMRKPVKYDWLQCEERLRHEKIKAIKKKQPAIVYEEEKQQCEAVKKNVWHVWARHEGRSLLWEEEEGEEGRKRGEEEEEEKGGGGGGGSFCSLKQNIFLYLKTKTALSLRLSLWHSYKLYKLSTLLCSL